MSLPPPAIVVTVPARTVPEARRQIEAAGESLSVRLFELRLDRFAASERDRLGQLFPSRWPLLGTLRSRAEGGEGPDDPEERIRILREIARLPFRWIDVESARDFPQAELLSRPGVLDLVVSSHYPSGIDPARWARLLRDPIPEGAIRKVVAAASVGQLFTELLPAVPPPRERPVVAHTIGPSGPLLRAWSRRLGFPWVFAALPERSPAPPPPVEASQIPADRLGAYLDSEGSAPLFAIVGHPVAHSRSPSIHSRWMREQGRVGLFVALDYPDSREFADTLSYLAGGGFRGLSVTHPLKQLALESASRVGPGASACGVANTLSFRGDEVEAENTDLGAVERRMKELRAEGVWDGESVGVIGAGGSARATLAAARSLGVRAHVWARRPEAAERLALEFGARAESPIERSRPTLVVHATTVGRAADGFPALPDFSWLRPGVRLLDWVYSPETPVVRAAAEHAGATYEDGSRLLVYQAAASFGIWWGEEPTPEQVSAVLEGKP